MAPANCSRCGGTHSVETYPSINVALDPELKARVRDGSLFVWECPYCGARNLVKYQTLYHDPAEKLMVWPLPGDAVPPQAVVDAAVEQFTAKFGHAPKVYDVVISDGARKL